jgi:hypothetical protein
MMVFLFGSSFDVMCSRQKSVVMPGLVPGIHVFPWVKAWMAGTSPAMTA